MQFSIEFTPPVISLLYWAAQGRTICSLVLASGVLNAEIPSTIYSGRLTLGCTIEADVLR